MMWRYPHLAGGLVDGLWFVVALAILVAAVALILWVVLRPRETGVTRPDAPARDPALEILRERLARGEINAAEFEEARRILGG